MNTFSLTVAARTMPVVVNLRSLTAKLTAPGYKVREGEPIDGYVRMHVDDPFGNRIEFIEACAD